MYEPCLTVMKVRNIVAPWRTRLSAKCGRIPVRQHYAHHETEHEPKGTLNHATWFFYSRTMEVPAGQRDATLDSYSSARRLPILDESDDRSGEAW